MGTTATAQREIIRFEHGRTETVCLKYATGKEVNGAGGPQFMFTTVDNRIFFIDPDVAYSIEKCGVPAGEPINITKSRGPRNTVNWDVRPADASPTVAPARQVSNTPTSAPTSLEQTLAASIAHVEARKAAQGAPARQEITPAQAKLMAALMCAIDAAVEAQAYATRRGMALAFTSEDVRTMAATLIISADRQQGGAR